MKCWRETWLHWKRRYDNEDLFLIERCVALALLSVGRGNWPFEKKGKV